MWGGQFHSCTEHPLTVIHAGAGIEVFWAVGKNSWLKPLPPGVRETCGSCGRQSASRSAFAAQMKSFSLRPPTSWVEYRTTQRSECPPRSGWWSSRLATCASALTNDKIGRASSRERGVQYG